MVLRLATTAAHLGKDTGRGRWVRGVGGVGIIVSSPKRARAPDGAFLHRTQEMSCEWVVPAVAKLSFSQKCNGPRQMERLPSHGCSRVSDLTISPISALFSAQHLGRNTRPFQTMQTCMYYSTASPIHVHLPLAIIAPLSIS